VNDSPRARWENDARRNARIRELRQQRHTVERRPGRRFQPLLLLLWFAGVAAVAAIVLFVGFLAFAPRLMAWVEENPGSIEQGIVLDFVRWYQPEALDDAAASSSSSRISVQIPKGATDSTIAKLLHAKGLIRSEVAFQYYVIQAGRQGTLQAGVYDLSPALRPSEIVAALRQEPGVEVTIRIQEGWRLEQIVGYLGTTKLTMNLQEFEKLVTDPPDDLLAKYDFFKDLPVGRSLEGYLYPDTYRVDANSTPRALVEKLLNTFKQRVTPQIRDKIAHRTINGRPMTLDQAVKLASIVEREAVLDKERPLIAGVYMNRLITPGWVLNADPTLQYGLATDRYILSAKPAAMSKWATVKWWAPLPDGGAKITFNSPKLAGYQTYLRSGLPPTPIAAPRLSSIQAVANANTDAGYFFFVAACPGGDRDGSHYFAKTQGEQDANIAKANAECPAG
jgi:UPF0755 protein